MQHMVCHISFFVGKYIRKNLALYSNSLAKIHFKDGITSVGSDLKASDSK